MKQNNKFKIHGNEIKNASCMRQKSIILCFLCIVHHQSTCNRVASSENELVSHNCNITS